VSWAAEPSRPPRVAWSMYKRFALGIAIVFLSTTAAVSTAALLEIKDASDIFTEATTGLPGFTGPDAEPGILDDVDPGGPQTIMVLGSDRRFSDIKAKIPARSDTIILIRLDPSKGATAVLSLPRDLRVQIPGRGTAKINEAYALGGPSLTVKTVRGLLQTATDPFPINHVVNVNFGGFTRAVDRLGCVYVDIDTRYFNDNSGPGDNYAEIDIPAGYQRLCGEDALGFVRYRHTDNDIVRAARQQDFLRQAKDQIGIAKLVDDRDELIRIFGRYTETDIRGTTAILRLIKLALESAKNPVREVNFDLTQIGEDNNDLIISEENLRKAAREFMNAQASKGPRGDANASRRDRSRERSQRRRRSGSVPAGLFEAARVAEDKAALLDTKVPFPVYYPRLAKTGSQYAERSNRAYDIFDRGRRRYRAYRMVVAAPGPGQYYGIQGMSWKTPPILDDPTFTREYDGRKLEFFRDGDRTRLIAWRTDNGVYWVSNTLLQSLSNAQMLGIARSLTRVGA
jgi:polyisoprenyl-teichoic acid--peptidoglycan teichoic acid transferase